jgi:hypothetical protein
LYEHKHKHKRHRYRLVLDVNPPEQAFFDSGLQGDSIIKPTDMLVKKQHNFKDLLQRTLGLRFNNTVTKYLTATHDRHEVKLTYVQSIQNTRYQLLNSTKVSKRICKSDQARTWLERAIFRDRKVFMVVEMEALFDATLSDHLVASRITAGVTAPAEIRAAAAVSGIVIPGVGLLVPGRARRWRG